MDEICEIVITAPDAEWLLAFTRQLVESRLVACGHHLDPIRAIYRWQGEIHDSSDARVALHTRRSLLPEIIDITHSQHPDDVPCIIALPILAASPSYWQWVLDETEQRGTTRSDVR